MANGFLSKEGIFTEAYDFGHFDIARKLLFTEGHSSVGYPLSPTDVLCDDCGCLYIREHYNGLAGGTREEKLDGVYLSNNYGLTDKQSKWLNDNDDILSNRQRELLKEIISR